MKTCPSCGGHGFIAKASASGGWPLYIAPEHAVEVKKIACEDCGGSGSITELKLAIMEAAGRVPWGYTTTRRSL